jgi:tetratricopeptide (TPR) repeat protein
MNRTFLPIVCSLLFTVIVAVPGSASEERLMLAERARADFELVASAPAPQLRDTSVCIQSQAAMLSVATLEEAPLLWFRKGYCALAAATVTREANSFLQAASTFDQAIAAWKAHNLAVAAKKQASEPLPSVLTALASISRLKAGQGDAKAIAAAVNAHTCNGSLTTLQVCEAIFEAGREWIGSAALLHDDDVAAAREFPSDATAWTNWVIAKRSLLDHRYADAATAFRYAVEAWEAETRAGASAPLRSRLGPSFDLSEAYTELGGARLLTGDVQGAIASLNQAVHRDSSNARALFLRARAREAAGQSEEAIADYRLAARNALAKGGDRDSAEADLYRGIAFYRGKEFTRAENEFSSALNFETSPAVHGDAVAWRRLAVVAGGNCEIGSKYLEEALPSASPYFPREEARAAMSACSLSDTVQR